MKQPVKSTPLSGVSALYLANFAGLVLAACHLAGELVLPLGLL